MRFLIDECAGPRVADWLRGLGHDVFSAYDQARGATDDALLQQAVDEDRIIVTNDKDFGDLIYREKRAHKGVIFMRLDDERAANKIRVLEQLLGLYPTELEGRFVVVSETRVRFGG